MTRPQGPLLKINPSLARTPLVVENVPNRSPPAAQVVLENMVQPPSMNQE